jgi:hypothetical protein
MSARRGKEYDRKVVSLLESQMTLKKWIAKWRSV